MQHRHMMTLRKVFSKLFPRELQACKMAGAGKPVSIRFVYTVIFEAVICGSVGLSYLRWNMLFFQAMKSCLHQGLCTFGCYMFMLSVGLHRKAPFMQKYKNLFLHQPQVLLCLVV